MPATAKTHNLRPERPMYLWTVAVEMRMSQMPDQPEKGWRKHDGHWTAPKGFTVVGGVDGRKVFECLAKRETGTELEDDDFGVLMVTDVRLVAIERSKKIDMLAVSLNDATI